MKRKLGKPLGELMASVSGVRGSGEPYAMLSFTPKGWGFHNLEINSMK